MGSHPYSENVVSNLSWAYYICYLYRFRCIWIILAGWLQILNIILGSLRSAAQMILMKLVWDYNIDGRSLAQSLNLCK